MPPLDEVISTLVRDLESRGLLDETVIVCAGEFGRTPRGNTKDGLDHWARSMAVLLAGGGFPGGTVYRSTDDCGAAPARDACSADDLAATVFRRLGFSPRYEANTAGGRPIPIFREGRCLESLAC